MLTSFPRSVNADFELTLNMRIPTWNVQYRPALSEVLKWGWIQYVTIFAFTGTLLWIVYHYLITTQLMRTNVTKEQSKNKDYVSIKY